MTLQVENYTANSCLFLVIYPLYIYLYINFFNIIYSGSIWKSIWKILLIRHGEIVKNKLLSQKVWLIMPYEILDIPNMLLSGIRRHTEHIEHCDHFVRRTCPSGFLSRSTFSSSRFRMYSMPGWSGRGRGWKGTRNLAREYKTILGPGPPSWLCTKPYHRHFVRWPQLHRYYW